ncbi:MAG: type II toxin-antitoxin system PemK/MazF family toxin [Verrucomicrobia bacterium]|nr:type II toxin-antitoxin system PemK/MazF family toxin [Verrucomicrobiota bacterium]
MPVARKGEVWVVDFGIAAKVRPALLLTDSPPVEALDLVTVILHTTSLRGNLWELSIPKSFLKAGAFHLQQIQSVPTARLERRLGALTVEEMLKVEQLLRQQLRL